MTFGILTINFRRPQIFKLFCASIRRLRYDTGIDFPAIVVSEPTDAQVCSEYNIGHIIHPNIPVSAKWDVGCTYLRELAVDYVIVLGADDILSTDCLRNIIKEMNNGIDLIGIKKIYIYACDGDLRGHLRMVTSRGFLGVAKTINKRVLDAVDWKPWADKCPRGFGMDALLSRNISPHIQTVAEVEGVVVDCQSKESLNKYTMFQGRHGQECNKDIFYNILSKEELQILNSIRDTGLPVGFPRVHKRGRTLI